MLSCSRTHTPVVALRDAPSVLMFSLSPMYSFADRVLVFHRGSGTFVQRGFYYSDKLDVVFHRLLAAAKRAVGIAYVD